MKRRENAGGGVKESVRVVVTCLYYSSVVVVGAMTFGSPVIGRKYRAGLQTGTFFRIRGIADNR